MVHLVPPAFFGACVADLRAELANVVRKHGAAGHLAFREGADVGAAPIKCDTARHHANVLFMQTGGRAVFARLRAAVTGFNAVLVFFVGHGFSVG